MYPGASMPPALEQPHGRAQIVHGESAGSRWEVATRAPAPALRAYVRDFMGYSEDTGGLLRRTELPGPQVVVIFEFGPPIRIYDGGETPRAARYPGGFVAGLSDRERSRKTSEADAHTRASPPTSRWHARTGKAVNPCVPGPLRKMTDVGPPAARPTRRAGTWRACAPSWRPSGCATPRHLRRPHLAR